MQQLIITKKIVKGAMRKGFLSYRNQAKPGRKNI